jgi:BMFP domain-containing protein YqiC
MEVSMADERSTDSIVSRLADALRAALPQDLPADLRERLRPAVESALDHAQLVPREEFERQLALLARLEAQARRLEQRVAELEAGRTGDRQGENA